MGGRVVQGWFVARTKPRREMATAAILGQRGIEVFVPTMASRRRGSARDTVIEPLFPGYLFARFDTDSDAWLTTRSAPGIAYFLGSDGSPSPLPDELVEAIRARTDERVASRRVIPFRQGESVLIKNGPFAGIEAVFDGCLTARGRVRVLLEIVQRVVPVSVDVHQLDKVASGDEPMTAVG
jgi:transcription elongation factor/antiterminator RfaH